MATKGQFSAAYNGHVLNYVCYEIKGQLTPEYIPSVFLTALSFQWASKYTGKNKKVNRSCLLKYCGTMDFDGSIRPISKMHGDVIMN